MYSADRSAAAREVKMSLFILTGCYTSEAARGLIKNPSNREDAARKIIEAGGNKLLSFYVTTGETDWMAVVEAADGADLLPGMLVLGASGAVSNLKTVRAYTGREFMAAQQKAGEIVGSYAAPLKS